MRTITQRIPNLLLGVSQQPDLRKFPGQVVSADNVFPDYALGMLKRPGGKYVSKLVDANTGGRWFSIIRDSNEKYVGQYADSLVGWWKLEENTGTTTEDFSKNKKNGTLYNSPTWSGSFAPGI